MTIQSEDITLKKFLQKFTPQFLSEAGKLTIPNEMFLQIASLLKISMNLQEISRKLK